MPRSRFLVCIALVATAGHARAQPAPTQPPPAQPQPPPAQPQPPPAQPQPPQPPAQPPPAQPQPPPAQPQPPPGQPQPPPVRPQPPPIQPAPMQPAPGQPVPWQPAPGQPAPQPGQPVPWQPSPGQPPPAGTWRPAQPGPGQPPRAPAPPAATFGSEVPPLPYGATPPKPPGPGNKQFCQPGLEIRCSCGPGVWEKTRCRDDGMNWEFCPCPEGPKEEKPRLDRPSPRSATAIGVGVALTSMGAIALGVSAALAAQNIPDCPADARVCTRGWIGVMGGGLVLAAVGIPFWVVGAAPVHKDERPRNTGLMVTGGFLAGLGTLSMASGATVLGNDNSIGWWPFVLGAVGTGGGIALSIYGGWEVPDVPEPEDDARWRVPRLVVGPGQVSVQGSF